MAIILCSFQNMEEHAKGELFSVARWQPKGKKRFRTLWFLAPFTKDREPIKMMPPDDYRKLYIQHVFFGPQRERINRWIDHLDPKKDITLMCWCNHERQARFPRLFCHTILIGYLIRERRPDIEVVFADGREKPVWNSLVD